MTIAFDPAKRERTLRERGLDFQWAARFFAGPTFDYGEVRNITVGHRRLDAARG
jgi:uncharacterized DUF497 family protein